MHSEKKTENGEMAWQNPNACAPPYEVAVNMNYPVPPIQNQVFRTDNYPVNFYPQQNPVMNSNIAPMPMVMPAPVMPAPTPVPETRVHIHSKYLQPKIIHKY